MLVSIVSNEPWIGADVENSAMGELLPGRGVRFSAINVNRYANSCVIVTTLATVQVQVTFTLLLTLCQMNACNEEVHLLRDQSVSHDSKVVIQLTF